MVHSMPLKNVSVQSYKATIRTFRSSRIGAFIFELSSHNLQICHIDGIQHLARFLQTMPLCSGNPANMYFSYKNELITLFKTYIAQSGSGSAIMLVQSQGM